MGWLTKLAKWAGKTLFRVAREKAAEEAFKFIDDDERKSKKIQKGEKDGRNQ